MILRMSRAFPRRFAAGLAILAMLLASLAPAITHAVNAQPGLALAAMICTQHPAPDTPHADVWDCCPFCSAGALAHALPPPACEPLRLDAGELPVPLLFLLAPRPPFAWAASRSRAPPSAS
jgi:hypothetical protein